MTRTTNVFCLLVSLVALGGGCATLPNVATVMGEVPTTSRPPHIASAKGPLSPKQSQALLERLRRSSGATDLLERYTAVIQSVSDSPLTKGNRVTLLIDGPATYAAMFAAVAQARDHIHLETFILEDIADDTGRKFADLLLQKRAEGVEVAILYDSVGSYATPPAFFQRLMAGGIQVIEFNPINPAKARGKWRLATSDHRKLLIVDGTIAITGGVNISAAYSSRLSAGGEGTTAPMAWRDTDVQIEGPAVAEVQKLFLETWGKQNGPPLTARHAFPAPQEAGKALVGVLGSTPGEANRITFIMYVAAITLAETSLHMTNAYFIPDPQTASALAAAAKRGVDVKILLPGNSDSPLAQYAGEYYYNDLLAAGVQLYQRRQGFLHAKTLVIDGVWSTVGSTNMDFWSFSTNDEVNAVILNRAFALEMETMFARDLAEADPVRWADWKQRPVLRKLRGWLAHLLGRWL
jgi:cardiolipin synthase A/B